jgi:L-aspartate oxidase
MPRYHPDGELAPRDAVSLAIIREIKRSGHTNVYLDARGMPEGFFTRRFPTINALCLSFGLDPAADLIPVRPAAHYMIGGVRADLDGRTDIENLLACGEVACVGLHGANRLASNSLLEALVFGRRCAITAAEGLSRMGGPPAVHALWSPLHEPAYRTLNLVDVLDSLKSLMWRNAGVVRDGRRLDEALEMIAFWCQYVMDKEFAAPQGWELQNMLTVALLVAASARRREESRGVHQRIDFPHTSADWERHIVVANRDEPWL